MKKKPSFDYENQAYANGFKCVAGVDEVGRGCLAGPVVAAAVILPRHHGLDDLNDSKVLSPQKRELLYHEIYRQAIGIGIGSVSPQVIDELNILKASIQAMKKAIHALNPCPDFIWVDGNIKIDVSISQQSIVKGDSLSQSIAAASIIAKVFRDHLMKEYNERYPHYDLAANKGYPTAHHLAALKKHGITDIHRKTFRGVRELLG